MLGADNTFTGTNSFSGIKNVAIAGNGDGAATPTAAIINDTTQDITGPGNFFGQTVPSFIQDTGTYNLADSAVFGIGALFEAKPTINLTAPGGYAIAGPYQALTAGTTVDKTHTGAHSFTSYPIWIRTTVNNTAGGSPLSLIENGMYCALTLGTNVAATNTAALLSVDPVIGAGSSVDANMGVCMPEKVVGTYNAGYQYGTVPTTPGNYAFDSSGSTHPVRFGGGVVKNYREDSSGTVAMYNTDYHVFSSSTGAIYLPAISTCEIGQIFVITNFSGTSQTVLLNGAANSYGKSRTIAYNDTRHFVKRSVNTWTAY